MYLWYGIKDIFIIVIAIYPRISNTIYKRQCNDEGYHRLTKKRTDAARTMASLNNNGKHMMHAMALVQGCLRKKGHVSFIKTN